MELRLLEYFLAVIEAGNVSKAAQKLHITQPTLTRQLQQLEDMYGSQLFIRGSRKITLTASGIILKRRAQEMLALQEKTRHEIAQSEHDISGTITIGCGESSGNQFLPIILKEFSKQYPNVKYDIFTAGSNINKEKVSEGLLDVAIVLEPIDKQYFQYLRLPYKDQWCLVMKKDDPLSKHDSITNEDLKDIPIALANRQEVRERFSRWLGKDIDSQIILQYDINSNLRLLVENDFCYGISIDGVYKNKFQDPLTYRLLSPSITSSSYMIWKKGIITSQPVIKFIDYVKEYIENKRNQNY